MLTKKKTENGTDTMQKLNVFISYSHKDEAFKEALDAHLTILKRSEKINTWNDRAILAGTEWNDEIKQQLEDAHIILLLISANFLASDYIWKEELARAMERHDRGEAKVVPIFIKHCEWKGASFGRVQGLPKDAKPVGDPNNDEAWTGVAIGIRALVDKLLEKGLNPKEQEVPKVPENTGFDQLKATVRGFIGKAKTKEAIEAIEAWAQENGDEQLKSDASLLKGDLADLDRDKMLGIIDSSEKNTRQNRLNVRVLSLLERVKGPGIPPIPPKPMPNIEVLVKAVNEADYATAIDLLDNYFGDEPTPQYSTLKQSIEHYLNQALIPPPATLQGLRMLINKLKK